MLKPKHLSKSQKFWDSYKNIYEKRNLENKTCHVYDQIYYKTKKKKRKEQNPFSKILLDAIP